MNQDSPSKKPFEWSKRFRGYLPVVVDVETGGFNDKTDALLEIAACFLEADENGKLFRRETLAHHVIPFKGSNIEPEALEVNHIKPDHPFRFAIDEKEALETIFAAIFEELKAKKCQRAVLVGHNPTFDLGFVKQACLRAGIKKTPFHLFTTFDTATLGALAYGQTVLARAVRAAGISFNTEEAHSAIYDTEKTADLFCEIVNQYCP